MPTSRSNQEASAGQGTSGITVSTEGLAPSSTVTATVDVGGYDRSCSTSASCTTTIEAKPAEAAPVVWEGRTFRPGDRVRVASRAGTAKPAETPNGLELDRDAGKTGVLVSGVPRPPQYRASPDEPIQLVLVRWDAQPWTDWRTKKKVPVEAFVRLAQMRQAARPNG